MSKQRLLVAAATALTLSACGMFSGMGGSRTSDGDGGSTGSEVAAACKGLTGTALQDCIDGQRLVGRTESRD